MNLNEFAKEVHQNAIAHGWWGEEYTDAELIAAIHSEISEAFEEWRAGRPMVWHKCRYSDLPCAGDGCNCRNVDCENSAGQEPHGIAVELIDVVLRILDAAAAWDIEISEKEHSYSPDTIQKLGMPWLIVYLHNEASSIYSQTLFGGKPGGVHFSRIVSEILAWLRAQNLDPEALLREKHNYNKTRPYRHGGKRV